MSKGLLVHLGRQEPIRSGVSVCALLQFPSFYYVSPFLQESFLFWVNDSAPCNIYKALLLGIRELVLTLNSPWCCFHCMSTYIGLEIFNVRGIFFQFTQGEYLSGIIVLLSGRICKTGALSLSNSSEKWVCAYFRFKFVRINTLKFYEWRSTKISL